MFFRAIYLNKTTVYIGQNEGLPNITGNLNRVQTLPNPSGKGAFSVTSVNQNLSGGADSEFIEQKATFFFDASLSNSIYGNNTHVTPSNISIKVWKRIS